MDCVMVPSLSSTLTQREIVSLHRFKEYLASNNLFYAQLHYKNDVLIRFLRARGFNNKEAYEMYINYLNWYGDNDIKNIRNTHFPNNDKLRLFYPHGFHKVTKQGLPIFIQSLGDLKINDINNLLPNNLLNMYIASIFEDLVNRILPSCTKASNSYIGQVTSIVDLKGLITSLMSKNIFDFINTQLSICEQYYPEILGGLYIVNSGFIFRAVWSVCKHFLSSRTQAKIVFYGKEYQEKLLERINRANLPKFLGGECNCDPYGCIFSNEGPWNTNSQIDIKNNTMTYFPSHFNLIGNGNTNEQQSHLLNHFANENEKEKEAFLKEHLTLNKRINDNTK